LAQARKRLASALADAGKESAALEARHLLEGASGLNSLELLMRGDEPLGLERAERLQGFMERRIAGAPVGRILGRSGFYGLDLLVTPDVLDPRADTETLVNAALDFVGARRWIHPNILDLGTGSGAILCALLDALPHATGIGVDLSPSACRIAQANLARCGLANRSSIACGNWAEALAGTFELIVSNPPYIALTEETELAQEVTNHDPALALYGGSDGLDCYRRIAPCLSRLLQPGGGALFEIGWRQAAEVAKIFEAEGFGPTEVVRDSGGRDRVVMFSRP
jgi:release factor glutamine methyltransferase